MSAATYVTAQILRVLPRARIGQALGHLADHLWSPAIGRAVVGLYSRAYDVALDEAAGSGTWPSFDAFFTRKLREGVRPVAPDPRTVVSPADGRIESMVRIDSRSEFVVKGRAYSVEELVGDAEQAKRFSAGAGFVVYLSPGDYHRVHAPVGGEIRRIRSIPGDYFPVNAVGMRHVANLLCRNRRVLIEIDADAGLGRVGVVMVVAMIVGRITAIGVDARDVPFGDHVLDPPIRIARGEEIGAFHLGSTAIVLVEEGTAGAWLVEEGPIRYGQALLRASGSGLQAAGLRASPNGQGA
ncbi:MAG: archaetidylserine decarboxylase [Polyangiaceae bacterium]|jgi:phosphatidylserine decarboxylase